MAQILQHALQKQANERFVLDDEDAQARGAGRHGGWFDSHLECAMPGVICLPQRHHFRAAMLRRNGLNARNVGKVPRESRLSVQYTRSPSRIFGRRLDPGCTKR